MCRRSLSSSSVTLDPDPFWACRFSISQWLIWLSTIVIYLVCAGAFVVFVKHLWLHYLQFETMVLVRFHTPDQVNFPSVTVCGCCLHQTVRNESLLTGYSREVDLLRDYTVGDLLDRVSISVDSLVSECTVRTKERPLYNCSQVRPVIESMYDGRKCFTYFSHLVDRTDDSVSEKVADQGRFTAHIQLDIHFPGHWTVATVVQMRDQFLVDNTLQNADIVVALHPPNRLPTMLDTVFYRVDPMSMYEIQFTK